ncbi:MAG: OmpA family protein [Duncaniella sp.]|nr:OmpA family protein [Duncaniella sp.]MDE5919036.1 OmpA family protein [Duncaniella sp.]MDE6327818.1 OmpA family protein [Duncaniella sp.]
MNHIILSAILLLFFSFPLLAKGKYVDPYKGYEESAFMDMDIENNIQTPVVGEGEHQPIVKHMRRIGDSLAKKGYIVDLTRNDEVVVVTLPTDDLFLPNDTLLSPSGIPKMTPIIDLLRDPEMFKLVYTVNTDNTGSQQYNLWLSHERNNSIYDWLLGHVSEDLIVIPYEMGDTQPVEQNNSRKGRAANRRVEFYLIPGPKMITQAHKGLLK